MAQTRTPRKTARQTVADNKLQIAAMCKLAGKPEPVFSEIFKPVKARSPAKPSIYPSEAEVLKSIMHYLRVHPQIAWHARFNSGMAEEGGRFVSYHSQRGLSDILCMIKETGQLVAIEVKSHNGRLSQHQSDFLDLIKAGGGLSGACKSIDDVIILLGFET